MNDNEKPLLAEGPAAELPSAGDAAPPQAPAREPDLPRELIAPTAVTLQWERGSAADRSQFAMVALTRDAIWIQEKWSLRRIALADVADIETRRSGKELVVILRPETVDERLRLTFASVAWAQHWLTELEARRLPAPEAVPGDRPAPEGVTLVEQLPDGLGEELGRVEFTDAKASLVNRGLQLRAGMLGADAVVGVHRCKLTEGDRSTRHANGLAVRVSDAAVRRQLR
jgi:hypothetical protein